MFYFQKPYLSIQVIQQLDLVHVQWSRFENSFEYREGLEQVLSAARSFRPQNWIFDLREITALRSQDQTWTIKEHMPLFLQTEPRNVAVILSEDFFSSSAIIRIRQGMVLNDNLNGDYFKDFESALAWIRSVWLP